MSRIVLDADLKARLNGLNEPLEVCDANGRTVGHFLPDDVYRKLLYRLAEAECPYTPEELRRMQEETGGQPLSQFWQSMDRA